LSGYDIRKAIESSVGYFWSESYGQIYPALKRLTTEGLITPSRSNSKPRQRRQEYSLTDAGRASLQAWLAQPFQNDPPRNEFLLKLFFGREAPPSVCIHRSCARIAGKKPALARHHAGDQSFRPIAKLAKPASAVLDAHPQPRNRHDARRP
jgi:DNA-binding PadR family transcriptional regulator